MLNHALLEIETMLYAQGYRPRREEGIVWWPISFKLANGEITKPVVYEIKARRKKVKTRFQVRKMLFPHWHQTTPNELLATILRLQDEVNQQIHPNDPGRRAVAIVSQHTCPHNPDRMFYGTGRDDGAPGGQVLWGACCTCGKTWTWEQKPKKGRKKKS